jgi:hypothetical protein
MGATESVKATAAVCECRLIKAMAAVNEGAGCKVAEYETAASDSANEPGTLKPLVEPAGGDPITGNEYAVLMLLQVAGASDNGFSNISSCHRIC